MLHYCLWRLKECRAPHIKLSRCHFLSSVSWNYIEPSRVQKHVDIRRAFVRCSANDYVPDGTRHDGGECESFQQNYRRDSEWDLMKSFGHLFTTTQFCVRKFTSSPRSAVKHHPHEKRSLKGTTQLFRIVPNFARPPPHNRHQFLINSHCAGKKAMQKSLWSEENEAFTYSAESGEK